VHFGPHLTSVGHRTLLPAQKEHQHGSAVDSRLPSHHYRSALCIPQKAIVTPSAGRLPDDCLSCPPSSISPTKPSSSATDTAAVRTQRHSTRASETAPASRRLIAAFFSRPTCTLAPPGSRDRIIIPARLYCACQMSIPKAGSVAIAFHSARASTRGFRGGAKILLLRG
jgi:hypothetical protein